LGLRKLFKHSFIRFDMAKSAYDYIKESMRAGLREKLMDWRASDAVVKVEKPFDIGRARTLGYKDKTGFVVVRVRVIRGGHKRMRPKKGRKVRNLTIRKTLKMSYQWIAEQRAARKYPNLEVLNSYKTAKDGVHYYFEVILLDTARDEIKNDSNVNWLCNSQNKGRAFRGLTSAAKKSRGLRTKSRQLKVRPSLRAWQRQGK
jgi:large subunit ribosomal protein L15e